MSGLSQRYCRCWTLGTTREDEHCHDVDIEPRLPHRCWSIHAHGELGVMAQEATPATESPFAGLGLLELTVTAANEGLGIDKADITAGR